MKVYIFISICIYISPMWWRVVQSVLTPKDVDIYVWFTEVLQAMLWTQDSFVTMVLQLSCQVLHEKNFNLSYSTRLMSLFSCPCRDSQITVLHCLLFVQHTDHFWEPGIYCNQYFSACLFSQCLFPLRFRCIAQGTASHFKLCDYWSISELAQQSGLFSTASSATVTHRVIFSWSWNSTRAQLLCLVWGGWSLCFRILWNWHLYLLVRALCHLLQVKPWSEYHMNS